MERTYTIYRVTSNVGDCYIGYTSLPIKERLRQHFKRAEYGASKGHPFYELIRKKGKQYFKIDPLFKTNHRCRAMEIEQRKIFKLKPNLNLSSGGVNDAGFGGKIFYERLNKDPKRKQEYLKKLSEIKKANDWTNYEELNRLSLKWRKDNPKLAYKISARNIRIANNSLKALREKTKTTLDTKSLKEKLMWKHRRSEVTRRNAYDLWARRSSSDISEIGHKISKAQKQRLSSLSHEEKVLMTAKARESIDRSIQGPAASKGIKKFWEELRADPQKYKDYMAKRTRTLMKTLETNKNDDL